MLLTGMRMGTPLGNDELNRLEMEREGMNDCERDDIVQAISIEAT